MKTIIACTDFSPNADNAIQYAAALAVASKARLLLYHHFDYPISATDLPGVTPGIFADDAARGFEARLKEIKRKLAKTHDLEIGVAVRSFDLSIDLETIFKEEEADLVVMGVKGQSAVVNAIFGSVASSTIRRGKLPLLVVPDVAKFQPVKKILFPYDDRHIKNPDTIRTLRDFALVFDAYIEVLTLFDLEKTPALAPKGHLSSAKSNLDHQLADIRHGFSYEHEEAINKGILYEAARSAADLVAMIPHHHSFLSNLLNQSRTQRIATNLSLPLLVLAEGV